VSTCKKALEELFGWREGADERRLLLFDGHSIAYRSFYAIRELTTRDGRPVNAVFGFWRIFTRIMRSFPSSYAAVAFDAGGETFRHRLYPEYKATRKEMPDELATQFPLIQGLLKHLGVHIVSIEGVEADDILASLARRAAKKGLSVLIATSDKDLAQLVDAKVSLIRPAGRRPDGGIELLDPVKVKEKYGVPPERIVDFLSLVGDTSDNIPGIPAVGPKTASRLLVQFGSLDAVLKNADQVRNTRVKENLRAHAEEALLARKLVTLDEEIAVGKVPEDYRLRGADLDVLRDLLAELDFHSVLAELDLEMTPATPEKKEKGRQADYRTILDKEGLDRLLAEIAEEEEVSLDLETTSRDPMRAKIVGIAVSPRPYTGYYIPTAHNYLDVPAQLTTEDVLTALRPVIEGERPKLIGQNLKYDLVILHRYGLRPHGVSFDAMIASHLARPEERHHNLETIARTYLDYEMLSYSELAGKDGKMAAVPVEKAAFYAAEDAEIVCRVKPLLEKALHEAGATKLFHEVEVPLVSVLARMEENGILVDRKVLAAQGRDLRERLSIIEEDLYEIAGERFNPNSPKQVARILFERLGLPVIERTKTGPSTSARVLSELAVKHPLPGKLIEYRELEKLLNTYIERLPEAINPDTGRIHTSFHQTATATGRLSSSDPNLQNIPIRTEVGERIRRAFVAPEGSLLIGADYSQIEIRLLAHLSGDEGLIEAFKEGKDLHRMTASRIFSIPEEEVTEKLRSAAKRINFGIIYGISPFGLARELGIPRGEAKAYIDRFFAAYPQAKEYMDQMIEQATKRGYAETILGRRRPLPQLRSKSVQSKNFAKRNAINTPIQGSAADLIKLAMLVIDRSIEQGDLAAKMLLQIHDELIFEVKEKESEKAMKRIKEEMEGVMELRLPLEVSVECGKDWSKI
jgi:DNA polymerase-1